MTDKENIRAILEYYFTGFKEEIKDSACNRILDQKVTAKTGHWIAAADETAAICSCCSRVNLYYGEFCKWCGAKMVKP